MSVQERDPDYELDEAGTPLVRGQGETEDDLESHDPREFQAALSSTDWTVETLVSQMRKGRIDLNPRFQRRNAWIDARKSRLVESVILRYPIPQIVLAEYPNRPGNFFVIDGKQRLLSLRQFSATPDEDLDREFDVLRLHGLEVRKDLNGSTIEDLQNNSPEDLARYENHTIRTVFISKWASDDLLLSMFLRLNTGSVTLSPQELRQALKPGPFSDWLDNQSIESLGLKRLLGHSEPDRRMIDAELLLRHLSLVLSPVEYRGNLKRFLDDTTGIFNDNWASWEPELDGALQDLESAIVTAYDVFPGDAICRKWTRDRWERPFNRAIFDVMMLAFANPEVRRLSCDAGDDLVESFQRLCDRNRRFAESITSTTKTQGAFRTRIDAWWKVIKNHTGIEFTRPLSIYWT